MTITVPDSVADDAQRRAAAAGTPVDEVVSAALTEYLGWLAIAETRAANPDLDAESAEALAYGELRAMRALRKGR